MTLHRLPGEEFAVDPADAVEVDEYIVEAEHAHCADLCERCGLKHPEPASRCPTANVTHLKSRGGRHG